MNIPKKFHQIWLDPEPMPPRFLEWQKTWTALNPGWDWHLWTEDDLPPSPCPLAVKGLHGHPFRSNIHRYEILEREGGVYVDVDCECTKPIESLISDCDAFLVRTKKIFTSDSPVNSSIMGCVPHHPLFQDLASHIESIEPERLLSIGDKYLLSCAIRHAQQHDSRTLKIIPAELMNPYSPAELDDGQPRKKEDFPNAHSLQHWSLMWHPSGFITRNLTLEGAIQQLSTDLNLPADSLRSFCDEDPVGGYLGNGSWPISCIREPEGQILYAITRATRPETILEFGTNLGCSTSHFDAALKANGSGRIITVDIDQGLRKIDSPRILAVQRDGPAYSASIDFPLDIIFDDGPHTASFTGQVLRNCLPHLKPGGLVLAHDICHPTCGPGVMAGIRDILDSRIRGMVLPPSDCGLGYWKKPRQP